MSGEKGLRPARVRRSASQASGAEAAAPRTSTWSIQPPGAEKPAAAPAPAPRRAPATEAKLLGEFGHDNSAKALLLLEIACYHEQAEREGLLQQAADALMAAQADEYSCAAAASSDISRLARASSASSSATLSSGPRPPAVPKPPQLVYRTHEAICVRVRPFYPSRGPVGPGGVVAPAPVPAKFAVYAKEAGVGVAVSLNNKELPGTGRPRAPRVGIDAYDPLADCFVIRGLPHGKPIVVAAAALERCRRFRACFLCRRLEASSL